MDVVVAVKQVPRSEVLELDVDHRLSRRGVALEMSAYCRRALAKGIEVATASGGKCHVVSVGPPSAEQVLREALACGADEATLLSDPALAGSDTLVTARALAALVRRHGKADLVLVGKASLDAETGQVGPQLAELLDLPFAGAVRHLELDPGTGTARVRCEDDDGGSDLVVRLPAVLALAERSCRPAKADPGALAALGSEVVTRLTAADLEDPGPWDGSASPTRVESVVAVGHRRDGVIGDGPVRAQVTSAIRLLKARGELGGERPASPGAGAAVVPEHRPVGAGPLVAAALEPGRWGLARQLLGAAARLAGALGGSVTAVAAEPGGADEWWGAGADETVELVGVEVAEDVASALGAWASRARPAVILVPATSWGREVAGRTAACLGAGLVADALDLEVMDGRLSCAKPACAGGLLATVLVSSPIQMATVRPGVLAVPRPRGGTCPTPPQLVRARPRGRVQVLGRWRDDDVEALERAEVVVGVGLGVAPEAYGEVRRLATLLGAELGATRKVTDRGYLPRSRQIGITGRNVALRWYLALGVGGSANHLAGVRRAGTVVAVNSDRTAPVFGACDIGIVGDWREAVAALFDQIG